MYDDKLSGDDELLEGEVLPPEEDQSQEAIEKEAYLKQQALLNAFGTEIAKLRDEAIKGRAASGIEQEWLEDEEHYEGIDDANRGEMPRKSVSPSGNVQISANERTTGTRSTIFLNITRPYVDAASARVSDMLLPTDDRNWAIRPTPVPSLVEQSETDERPAIDQSGQQVMMPASPIDMPKEQAASLGMMVPAKLKDVARELIEKAKKQAEKAQDRIDDWLQECRYHAEVRLVIESSARIGTGIMKGPFPKRFRRKAVTKTMQGVGIIMEDAVSPASKWIDVWNLFPDPACGDNIHNGKYVFERDELTARRLIDLKGLDGYIEEAIEECLKEGPLNLSTGTTKLDVGQKVGEKDRFEVWYFHGYVSAEELNASGCECEDGEQYPAIVTMVNNRVIKAALEPLDSGEFPYDVMVWQRRVGSWAGIGVGRQMRTCQRGVNAAARNLMDNAGLSAGPQIVIDRSKIIPADGDWTITPRKIWWTVDGADMNSARDAFLVVQIASLQAELMNILQLYLKMAEDVTGLPMLIQGQQGKAPDTVGGMTMLNNNATSVLRRIARTFDDRITEPHIARYYEWLLMHGEDDEEKGDFTIDARGSSALVERDLQNQAMMGLVGASMNPAFGLDPELVMEEALKAQRLDPKRLQLTDEKKAQMAQRQPPPAPQVQVAQIREEGAMQRQQVELQAEAQERQQDRMLDQWLAQVDERIEAAKLTTEQRMAFDDLKVSLQRDVLKLRTQKELANTKSPQVLTPPSEPPQRALPGQAYFQ